MKIQQTLFKILKKQNVTDGRTDGRTHGWTDNVKTVYPTTNKVCGGYKNSNFSRSNSNFSILTPTFSRDGFYLSCFQNPSENSANSSTFKGLMGIFYAFIKANSFFNVFSTRLHFTYFSSLCQPLYKKMRHSMIKEFLDLLF